MSGAAGGSRITRDEFKATIQDYKNTVLKPLDLDTSSEVTGFETRPNKESFGDIDIVLTFKETTPQGGDIKKHRAQLKQEFAKFITQIDRVPGIPHKGGKKYFIHGNIVSILYPIAGREDEYVQIDNIVAIGEEEAKLTHHMLDLPAEVQGLVMGIVKAASDELGAKELPNLFDKLGITNPEKPGENEEYDFSLNTTELTLSIAPKYGMTGKSREIWRSTDIDKAITILMALGIDTKEDTFDTIIAKIKKFKTRSLERIKGMFKAVVRAGDAELGTEKGNKKQQDLKTVAALQESGEQKVIAVFPGKFKPPHKDHIARILAAAQDADEVIVLVSPKTEPGGNAKTKKEQQTLQDRLENEQPVTADQSLQIFKLANLPKKVTVMRSDDPRLPVPHGSPVTAAHKIFEANPEQRYIGVFGKGEDLGRFGKVPENVEVKNYDSAAGNLSATDVRTALKAGEDIAAYLPDGIDQQKYKEIILGKSQPKSIEDRMADSIDEVFNTFFPKKQSVLQLNEGKFAYEKPLSSYLQEALSEISFSRNNAADIQGDLTGGTFTVGNKTYRYDIKLFPNPYNDKGTFYNIGFTPQEQEVNVPTQDTPSSDYVKILSTMYKIILDFVEKEQPDYVGIASMDNPQGKNYHVVYNSLTDNKANRIPGYFRKDANLTFNSEKGSGRIIVMKKKKEVQPLDEASSGTPVSALATVRSADRATLANLYEQLRDIIPADEFDVIFQQDRIYIYNKQKDQVGFDYTPYQKHLGESVQDSFDYTPHIASILEYMMDQGMKITPLPDIITKKDPQQATDFFGKTAYYSPSEMKVVLYTLGRHPKDVCRSFTHEMIHHMQNIQGRLGNINTTNTNEDSHLQEIEDEAYLEGNRIFRNWEDGIKSN